MKPLQSPDNFLLQFTWVLTCRFQVCSFLFTPGNMNQVWQNSYDSTVLPLLDPCLEK